MVWKTDGTAEEMSGLGYFYRSNQSIEAIVNSDNIEAEKKMAGLDWIGLDRT